MRRLALFLSMMILCSIPQAAMAQLSAASTDVSAAHAFHTSNEGNTTTVGAADIEITYSDNLEYWLNHTTGEASIKGHSFSRYSGEAYEEKTLRIPETVNGCRVTSVGPGAFTDLVIDTLAFPETLRALEDNALQFASIRHIVLPASVEEISQTALVLCAYEMLSVDEANPHFAAKDNILYNKDFTILLHYPETLQNASFTVADSVTKIGVGAFYGAKLTSISLPDSIVEMGDYAFSRSALTSFTVPPQVTALSEDLFAVCESLSRISLHGKLVSIGRGAFSNCLTLGNTDLPSGIRRIGDYAFNNCKAFTSVALPPVSCKLGDGVYAGCDSLREIVFPDGVQSIPPKMFYDCDALACVTIPAGVHTIGESAFSGGDALSEIRVSPGNKSFRIENGALLSMDGKEFLLYPPARGDTAYTIPEGVTTIAASAFDQAIGLKSIQLPKSLQSIEANAFYGCTALTSITLPNGVRSIGHCAFDSCESLTKISLPQSLRSVGDYAFTRTAVTAVALPDKLDSLGVYAFCGCEDLESIVIPASCARISDGCFAACGKLTDVTIRKGVTSIGKCAFLDCYGIEALSIPDSVTSISSAAFAVAYNCGVDTLICTRGSYTDTVFCSLIVANRAYNDHRPLTEFTGMEIANTREARISAICYVDEGNALMLRIENHSDEAIFYFRATWDGSWYSGHPLFSENPYEGHHEVTLQPGETGDYFMSLRLSPEWDRDPSGFRLGASGRPYDADDTIAEIKGKPVTISAYAEDRKTELFRVETIPFPDEIG